MKLTCAWKNGSPKLTGENGRPDKCDNCPGEFRRRVMQIPEFRKNFPMFLPDIETIMKLNEARKHAQI